MKHLGKVTEPLDIATKEYVDEQHVLFHINGTTPVDFTYADITAAITSEKSHIVITDHPVMTMCYYYVEMDVDGNYIFASFTANDEAFLIVSPSTSVTRLTKQYVDQLQGTANAGKYLGVSGTGTVTPIAFDSALSDTSTNAVQNKVIQTALNDKAPIDHDHDSIYSGVDFVRW